MVMRNHLSKKIIVILMLIGVIASAMLLTACGSQQQTPQTKATDKPVSESECDHPKWVNGICTVCGAKCKHESYSKKGICQTCGSPCPHQWSNGTCFICGMKCTHEEYEDGVCKLCGLRCDHIFVDGVCGKCGMECEHKSWYNGICTTCNIRCSHEKHDPVTMVCERCESTVPHKYKDSLCVRCTKQFSFTYEQLPDQFYKRASKQGTVQSYYYPATNIYDGEVIYRKINIYLPYGYNPNQKYNVLVLIHGAGGSQHDFTDTVYSNDSVSFSMKDLYDNMFAENVCDPCIIVSPSTTTTFSNGTTSVNADVSADQLAVELREIVLPYLADMYSTYAASGKEEDIIAAREHFGIGGISNGSLFALNSGMINCFDLFGNFICLSGNSSSAEVVKAINSEDWIDLPVYCFYAGAATEDGRKDDSSNGYKYIVENTERLEDGKNAFYANVEGGHDWLAWSINFYNALQLIFPPAA